MENTQHGHPPPLPLLMNLPTYLPTSSTQPISDRHPKRHSTWTASDGGPTADRRRRIRMSRRRDGRESYSPHLSRAEKRRKREREREGKSEVPLLLLLLLLLLLFLEAAGKMDRH